MAETKFLSWWAAGSDWLLQKANEHFHQWTETKDGQRWRKAQYKSRVKNKSPYYFGYSQPEWIREAQEALGKNDEEGFKAIKLANL
jgi:hypothetical protein